MPRRLAVLAFLILLLICLLTFLGPGQTPRAILPAARAQEPVPAASELGPLLRDPATVASELLLEPSPPAVALPERPATRWASRAYTNDVGGALSRLRRQVVQLKQDITTDLRGDQRRWLSREADNALDALDDFESRLVAGRPRAAVSEDYAAAESRVRALARDARASGLGRSVSRDPAGWVAMADERLGEAVSQGEAREVWAPALVAREADNLVFFARDLERQGEYGLSAGPGRRALQHDLHSLTDAAEFFRASVAAGSPRARLAKDIAALEEVWARVASAVPRLNREERLLLAPRASRVEDMVFELHRRLGLAGAPAHVEATAEAAQPANGFGPVLPAAAPR
jgi:hypothetical protein